MTRDAIATLLSDWQELLGPVPPGARAWGGMRSAALRARQFRLHNLPGSKRYAECAVEMALILERQNTLLSLLIGEGTPYTLLFTQYGGEGEIHAADYARFVDDRLTLLFSIDEYDCTPAPFFSWRPHGEVCLYARQQRWASGAEDALLAAVADDEIAGTLFFCPARGVLFSPYDGGFDIIAASPSQRRQLCERFAAWLPGGSKKDPSLVIDSAQPEARETVRLLKKERDATVYLGADGAVEVVKLFVMDVDDALLARLGALPRLRILMLLAPGPVVVENRVVTDTGLRSLHRLRLLDVLNLEGFVGVTSAGVDALRAALPGCEVVWEGLRGDEDRPG